LTPSAERCVTAASAGFRPVNICRARAGQSRAVRGIQEMAGIQEFFGLSLAVLSFVAAGFTVAAAATLGARLGSSISAVSPTGPRMRARPITILKPLHLAEAGLKENLRSFLQQEYDGAVQIIFGVASRNDSALAIVSALRADFPSADIDVIAGPMPVAANPKIANLINMVARAEHDLLVLSDSDICVPRDYLQRIVAAFEGPNVGAVSLLYTGRPLGSVWSKLVAMNIDCHFLPNAQLGMALGLARPCFGSTIAFMRQTLDEIGGFESLSNVLADDYELGRAIRARGYDLAIPDFTVEHACSEKNVSALFRRELRWAKTNLLLAKVGYIGSIVTYPLPLALLVFLFLGATPLSLSALAGALASRLFLLFTSGRRFGGRRDYVWLLPLRDVLSFFVYLAAFFSKTVEWRGHRFATRPDGMLAPVWR
jgi:ceramide glucosyltransferase